MEQTSTQAAPAALLKYLRPGTIEGIDTLTYCQCTETDSWLWAPNISLQVVLFFGTAEGSFYFQADESTQILIDTCRNVTQTCFHKTALGLKSFPCRRQATVTERNFAF